MGARKPRLMILQQPDQVPPDFASAKMFCFPPQLQSIRLIPPWGLTIRMDEKMTTSFFPGRLNGPHFVSRHFVRMPYPKFPKVSSGSRGPLSARSASPGVMQGALLAPRPRDVYIERSLSFSRLNSSSLDRTTTTRSIYYFVSFVNLSILPKLPIVTLPPVTLQL
ncbi:hypothetical protein VTK26DRAFT_6460 [Humicola hyalothermophila]